MPERRRGTRWQLTAPHLGWMCMRTMPSYRAKVVGLRCAWPASQRSAQSPTVTFARVGSTYAPVAFECSTPARKRSASILRLKVLLRCAPAGVR